MSLTGAPKMKLSVAMIVKNEEEMLGRCLESVKEADEIIIVDTGSTDKTIEIAKKYTDKVYTDYKWNDDFSEARNKAIEHCTGDWILSIDADHQLITSIVKVKEEATKAHEAGQKVAKIKSCPHGFSEVHHLREVLFQNSPNVRWKGKVHECITPATSYVVGVERTTYWSGNHAKDPDRNLRILLDSEPSPRRDFYLGREYADKSKYKESLRHMQSYLKHGTWPPEKAEAWLTLAKCYWQTQEADKAREACLKAIGINPDFKEALLFMSAMYYEPMKSKWKQFAELATNNNVLFIRKTNTI